MSNVNRGMHSVKSAYYILSTFINSSGSWTDFTLTVESATIGFMDLSAMKRTFLIFLFVLSGFSVLIAQNISIPGSVTTSVPEEGTLPGVAVSMVYIKISLRPMPGKV